MAENAQMQEVFDRVARHLLTQKEKAGVYDPKFDFTSCRYRAPGDGKVLKCAVGCLISDAAYTPKLEGRKADSELVLKALTASGIDVSGRMTWMLENLQVTHDGYKPGEWPHQLHRIAKTLKLDARVVNELSPE